jgi:hypothetical protein
MAPRSSRVGDIMFRLEGVTVSVNYADYLAETLPMNKPHFDRLIVVTTPEDEETHQVCRYYRTQMVWTDAFRSRWAEFHKAEGINKGLAKLDMTGWVCHLDADIALPPPTRDLIENANLDRNCLYGVDRFIVKGSDEWQAHQALPALQHDDWHVHLDAFDLSWRFSGQKMGGYAPPGYFQLWHPGQSNIKRYPEQVQGANKTDVLFTAKWPRSKRHLLPEFVAYHLESEPCELGANWGGRVTRRFGADPEQRHRRSDHHHHHHHHHHPEPYREPDTNLSPPSNEGDQNQ